MEKKSFEYSVVILTGGSSGIGASFLASILDLKQKVVICNLSRHKPELFEGQEGEFYHIGCDLSRSEAIEEVFPKIRELLRKKGGDGRILLINNSGFGEYGEFQDRDLSNQISMIELNVCGVVHLTGLMLPLMMERGGAIINVASTAAFQPTPYMATYGATKSFVLDWSLALREDLRGKGIRVLALCPGPTESSFFGRAGFDLEKASRQPAEEVVEVAWKALESDKGFVVSGFRNKVIVCIVKFLPLTLIARISGIILRRVRS